jgi:hypothetical protein
MTEPNACGAMRGRAINAFRADSGKTARCIFARFPSYANPKIPEGS